MDGDRQPRERAGGRVRRQALAKPQQQVGSGQRPAGETGTETELELELELELCPKLVYAVEQSSRLAGWRAGGQDERDVRDE